MGPHPHPLQADGPALRFVKVPQAVKHKCIHAQQSCRCTQAAADLAVQVGDIHDVMVYKAQAACGRPKGNTRE
jgi:hypothetical protein